MLAKRILAAVIVLIASALVSARGAAAQGASVAPNWHYISNVQMVWTQAGQDLNSTVQLFVYGTDPSSGTDLQTVMSFVGSPGDGSVPQQWRGLVGDGGRAWFDSCLKFAMMAKASSGLQFAYQTSGNSTFVCGLK